LGEFSQIVCIEESSPGQSGQRGKFRNLGILLYLAEMLKPIV
jgi:hypothetical protein